MGLRVLTLTLAAAASCRAATVAGREPRKSLVDLTSSSCIVVRDPYFAGQDIKIEPKGTNAVRVRAVPSGGSFVDGDDIISAFVPASWPAPPSNASTRSTSITECTTVVLSKDSEGQTITRGNLKAAVGADGRLTFTRMSDGAVLLTEKTVRTLAPTTTVPPVPGFLSLDLAFASVVGERIYGLGQHAAFPWAKDFPPEGQLDQMGLPRMKLEPGDGDVTIPVAHSSLGYAFLSNLPSTGFVEYNKTGSFWRHDSVKQMDIWVATTADSPPHTVSPWQQLQAAYVDATGHSPVWPEWTTGFWQCKLRYSNQSQIMAVANEYVRRNIPLSLIIIDFFSWNDPVTKVNTIGDETLPPSCWPNPKLMVDELKELGVELMVSPYSHSVGKASHNYHEAEANHYLATDRDGNPAASYAGGFTYDLFNPAARAYAWDAMQKGYVAQYGLHHWWLDCDEPCGGTNDGTYATDWLYNDGKWPAAFVGAAFPTMLDRTVYEGMGAPGKEYAGDNVMLGRAGWAGSQRFGGGVWSGDTHSTWNDFNQQFRAGLNMVMSGIVYWTTDIGGFGGGNTESADFRELIVRWFQWGAFCPLFRLHGDRKGPTWPPGPSGVCGADASNEVWMFGNESEAAIVKVMRIREQMRPYVMEQYRKAAADGTPIMRPIFYDFYNDTTSQHIDDQQMFGPLYLVAPVLEKGVTSRKVYLPPLPNGTVWTNVFTGVETDTAAGGKTISELTPLDTFPLYKRHQKFPYPAPPPQPKCDNSCAPTANTDVIAPNEIANVNSSSFADCCAKCKANSACESFVWGNFIEGDPSTPPTCFQLGAHTSGLVHKIGRTYGCVRA